MPYLQDQSATAQEDVLLSQMSRFYAEFYSPIVIITPQREESLLTKKNAEYSVMSSSPATGDNRKLRFFFACH